MKKTFYKMLSQLLVFTLLLGAAPFGQISAYAAEEPSSGTVIDASGELLATTTAGTKVFEVKQIKVWAVSNTAELDTALSGFQSGDIIKLTENVDYNQWIPVDNKTVTFDTNGFTLNVFSSTGTASGNGLQVNNGGHVKLAGSGQFNIVQTGGNTSAGVIVFNGSTAEVTNIRVFVDSGSAFGAYASGSGSAINVLGNITVIGEGGCGAKTFGDGKITVDGFITASSYINIGSVYKAKSSGVEDLSKPGYLKYSTPPVESGIVWVKKVPVCEISGTSYVQYFTLEEALAAVKDDETITLLQNIDYDKGIIIDGIVVTFNVDEYTLNVANTSGTGLVVKNSGQVNLQGTGAFNVESKYSHNGVEVYENSAATVTSVKKQDNYSAKSVLADGAGAKISVKGNVVDSWSKGITALAQNGGQITIDGTVTAAGNCIGLNAGSYSLSYGTPDPEKPRYLKYNDIGTSTIWIWDGTLPTVPEVQTNPITDVTSSGAILRGYISSTGGSTVTERGFVHGATANPTLATGTKVVAGSGADEFMEEILGLTPLTTYHVRAYATNSQGTSYGLDMSFTTLPATTTSYPITVQSDGNGTAVAKDALGNVSSASPGTEITLIATPKNAYRFKEWQVVGGGVNIVNNKLVMPAANVTVKAIFELIPSANYSLVVNSSYSGTSGAGSYEQGVTVTIYAGSRSGYSFAGWTSSDGITFTNTGSATTSFVMPAKKVTVTANWSYNSSGGSSSSGGYTPPASWNITIDKKPNQPSIALMDINATIDTNGNAAVIITDEMTKALIEKAQSKAKENSKTTDGIGVVFNSLFGKKANGITIMVEAAAIDRLEREGARLFGMNNPLVNFTLDAEAIKEANRQTSGNLILNASPIVKLSVSAKNFIGSRPVFGVKISYKKDGKKAYISNFKKGKIILGIAYTPTSIEKSGNLYGVYMDKKSTPTLLSNSSYDNKRLNFSQNKLVSYGYGVGYKTPALVFNDTEKHWAKDNIDFVASRGLISGTSDTSFAPDTAITRATFLMALGKLSGVDVSGNKASSFTDVKNTDSAMPYIEWAVKSMIVQGIGNNQFGPNRQVTREQMAMMIVNYAKATGYTLPVSRQAVTFADDTKISSWAKEAVKTMQQTGVITGKSNNLFEPAGNVTRAEASTILRRFVKLVIDEGTARGWVQNDSGQWQFIDESGKVITGWLTVGNTQYYFTSEGIMVSGKWLEIESKWYYFDADGYLARNTKIDGYEVDEKGVRIIK